MSLIRWNPSHLRVRDIDAFHDEVNRLFGDLLAPVAGGTDLDAFVPSTDVEETAEQFILRLDVPGVSLQDVRVAILGDTLTIRGERKAETETKESSVYRRERRFGSFERAFKLGRAVKADQVQATYRDGVLEVRVPKSEEARVREIEIKVQ